jgi:hypothetical protein
MDMHIKSLIDNIEQKSAEFKENYQDMSKRLMSLEQKAAGSNNVNFGGNDHQAPERLKGLTIALAASGNATAKVSVPMQKSILLQGVSAGKLMPTEKNIGVFAQAEQLSLSSQLHSFPTDAAVMN